MWDRMGHRMRQLQMTDTPVPDLFVHLVSVGDWISPKDSQVWENSAAVVSTPAQRGSLTFCQLKITAFLHIPALPEAKQTQCCLQQRDGVSFCKGKCSSRAKSALSCQAFPSCLSSDKEHNSEKKLQQQLFCAPDLAAPAQATQFSLFPFCQSRPWK